MSKQEGNSSIEEAEVEEAQVESSSAEGLKKLVYKYQARVRDLNSNIAKQKKTNDQLKEELKTLNQTLNQLISKVAVRPKNDKEEPPKEEVLRKELELEMKKGLGLRKETELLRAKVKAYESQKIGDLHNEIREKDRVIEDLHQSLRLHERLQKKDMVSDIYRKEEEAQKKITMLTEEVAHLRKKAQEQRKHHEAQERSILQQQRKINELEQKQPSGQKHTESPAHKFNETSGPPETYQLLLQDNRTLKQQLLQAEKGLKAQEKLARTETEAWKNRCKAAEKNSVELREQLVKKEKEVQSLWLKLKSLGGTEREEVEADPVVPSWRELLDCRRELRGSTHLRSSSRRFDDVDQLPPEKDYRIKAILFRYFEQHIIQMRITYDLRGEDRENRTVTSFQIEAQYQSTKEVSLQLSDYEYITEWEIFLGRGIQYLRVRTSKDQTLEAGNERNQLKCKRMVFEIKSFEKPVACFGVLDHRTVGERDRQVLVGLGLVLKRKNVLGSRAHSLARLERGTGKVNDKNLI